MDKELEELAEELWDTLTQFDFDPVSKCPIVPCKGSENYKKKVAEIRAAFKRVAKIIEDEISPYHSSENRVVADCIQAIRALVEED